MISSLFQEIFTKFVDQKIWNSRQNYEWSIVFGYHLNDIFRQQWESRLPPDVQQLMAQKSELTKQLNREQNEKHELFMQVYLFLWKRQSEKLALWLPFMLYFTWNYVFDHSWLSNNDVIIVLITNF